MEIFLLCVVILFSVPIKKTSATIMVISSAVGTASHTPVTPKISGNVSNSTVISPKVRRNDKIADSFPFDNAVNVAEVKIFSPRNRKLKGKIKNHNKKSYGNLPIAPISGLFILLSNK